MTGGHRRTIVFLRALAAISDSVEILYLVPERLMSLADDQDALDRSQSRFWGVDVKVLLAPRRSRVETTWNHYGKGVIDAAEQPNLFPFSGDALAEIVGRHLDTKPDLVLLDRLDAALPVLKSGRRPERMVFNIDDVYHVVLGRALAADGVRPGKVGYALHLPSLVLLERRAVAMSAASVVCSERDVSHLRHLGFPPRITVIPNAITPPANQPPVTPQPIVLFLGAYHHPPNRLAAERLARNIWPLVIAALPGARLVIAGGGSDTLPSRHGAMPGIEYLGYVDDLADLYAKARVFCAPIYTGSGTRLKIIEAASYGRPIVATPMAAEGLAFRDGHDILLRSTDKEIADACVALLTDDGSCRRLGDAARRTMLDNYDANAVEARARSLFERVLAGSGDRSLPVRWPVPRRTVAVPE